MQPETKYAFIAALAVVVPGFALGVGGPLGARLVWGAIGEPLGILAGGLGLLFNYLVGEQLVIPWAERAAQSEARQTRLLAEVRHPTMTGGLAHAVARGCARLERSWGLQALVAAPFLAVLIAGIATWSMPLMLAALSPAVALALAWGFVGVFLSKQAFEEDAPLREDLRWLKTKSLFRLRYRGMAVAVALPLSVAVLVLLLPTLKEAFH